MGRGGARKGAGRKSNRELYEKDHEAVHAFISRHCLKYVKNLHTLAMGVQVERGGRKVWAIPPSQSANVELLNRHLSRSQNEAEYEVLRAELTALKIALLQKGADSGDVRVTEVKIDV